MATDVRNRRPARKTGPRAAWKTGFYYTRGTPPRPAPRGPRRKKPPPGAADPRRATPGGRTPGGRTPGRRTPAGEPRPPRAAKPRAGGTDPGPGGEPRRAAPARPRPGPDLRGRGDRISTNLSLETAPLNRVSFRHIQGVGSWPEKQKAAAHDGQLPSK